MAKTEFDEETKNILESDEPKFIKALELYYKHFDVNGNYMSFRGAANRAGVNPAFLVDYMFYRGEYNCGMPGCRKDALEFLENLRRLKKDVGYKVLS